MSSIDQEMNDATSQPEPELPPIDLSAYKALYLTEAKKVLANLRQALKRLNDRPADRSIIAEAHRAAHTLKGMSATMHYKALVALAKSMEATLGRANREGMSLYSDQIENLLALCGEFEAGLAQLDAEE